MRESNIALKNRKRWQHPIAPAVAWTLATTMGWAIAWSSYALFNLSVDLREPVSVLVWLIGRAARGLLAGLICGFGQYLVLRNWTRMNASWVATVALSWLLSWPIATVGSALGFSLGLIGGSILLATLPACGGGLTAGALAGWIQWRALNRRVELSGLWILASMFGWSVGWATVGLAITYLGPGGQTGLIVGGIISGAMIGASTGSLFMFARTDS